MKPPIFEYRAVESVEEAHGLLQKYGSEARILAGGQSLIPMMKMRLARPTVLLDINRLFDLDFVREHEGYIAVGATSRLHNLSMDGLWNVGRQMFCQALPHIGHVATRHRGTVCGSFAFADPGAELPVIGSCLQAEIAVTSTKGTRQIPAEEFFVSFYTTSLADDEMIQEVRFPRLPTNAGCSFVELSKRHAKFAIVAATIVCDADKRIAEARIAVGAVGERPVRAGTAERSLVGETGDIAKFRAAAATLAQELDPPSDTHGNGEFRKRVAQTLVVRALEEAWSRAAAPNREQASDKNNLS
jgi:aerobic carbon-monoxide dehydrogenase medium subunit